VIAQAEASLQEAQQRVQRLEAELPALTAAIDAAREQVLVSVQRQLAAKEALWRGYWPNEDAPAKQAVDAEVEAKAVAYRQARQRAAQAEQALAAARPAVYAARQALAEARREALVREQAPELWQRWQRALRARDRDPLVTGPERYDHPGDSVRARARHQQAVDAIEQEITGVLQTAGV
jgi:hypothetical protein